MHVIDSPRRPSAGLFRLRVTRNGRLVREVDEPNLVVDSIDSVLARALVGDARINTIGIGSSVVAAMSGDTDLADQWTRLVQSTSHPSPSRTRFTWTIFASEGPVMTVREFGLFSDDGTLCARKVLSGGGITKEAGVQLEGEWTLVWT